ncbi:MAG: TIGR02206 family membrane protein [Peptoniphilus sp.]|nr:TIGR02206 family membrane protein [Peptoniphilus sp.]
MNFWNFFFRLEEDNFKFKQFGRVHLIMLFIMIAGALSIYVHRQKIRENKGLRKILDGAFLLIILLQQSMFLYFYFVLSPMDFKNGLPLYTCRIALYTTFFGILFNSSNLKSATIYLGLAGGIVPMIIPDLQAYAFPHILYVSFFITHLSVFWASLMFLIVDEYTFDRSGFIFMCKFTNAVLATGVVVNMLFDANYAYLSYPPVFRDFFESLPQILYLFIVATAYNLANFIIYRIGSKFKNNP